MLGKISLVPFSLKVRDIRIFFFRTLLMVPTVSYSDRYSFIFYKNKSSLSCDQMIYLIICLSPYIQPSLSMITNMWNRLLKSSLRLVAQKFNLFVYLLNDDQLYGDKAIIDEITRARNYPEIMLEKMREYRQKYNVKNIIKKVLRSKMLLSLTVEVKGRRRNLPNVNMVAFQEAFL